ncbi:hypothetical protein BG58_16505 [Caballeronia jiangsuensis]|nr:hypothetical protein BG58_16505 [Caballeronia jiangsuensis]
MRITIKLDAFDHTSDSAFAVLWLDRENGRWSREGHDCLDVPTWGTWKSTSSGTQLFGPDASNAAFTLHGLRLGTPRSMHTAVGAPEATAHKEWESQKGRADYFGCDASSEPRSLSSGHWHVQCIDRESTIAEHEVFSDEPDTINDGSARAGNPGSLAT